MKRNTDENYDNQSKIVTVDMFLETAHNILKKSHY